MEIAKYYTDAFFSDCKKLNIKTPDVVEPATNCIPEFIHMIEVLLENNERLMVSRQYVPGLRQKLGI